MILLWGIPSDPPLAAVEAELSRRGVPCLFLDQRATPQTMLRLEVDDGVTGALTVFEKTVRLDDIRAVYPRPHELTHFASVAQEPRPGHAAALYTAISVWLDVTPAFVLNRPAAMALNASKPYQAALIEAAGMRTPPTLLTTDPDAAASFRSRHGIVIYKSISAMRSVVARLGPEDETRSPGRDLVPNAVPEAYRWLRGARACRRRCGLRIPDHLGRGRLSICNADGTRHGHRIVRASARNSGAVPQGDRRAGLCHRRYRPALRGRGVVLLRGKSFAQLHVL